MTVASVTQAATYPISDVADVALSDGQSIHIRPVVAHTDGALILDTRMLVELAPDRRPFGALRT